MSKVSRGNQAEVRCVRQLQEKGWLAASRRHIGGAGDVLAVKWRALNSVHDVRLIEVKAGLSAWKNFTKDDRAALKHAASMFAAEAYLYFYPTGQERPEVYHWTAWPGEGSEGMAA